LRPLIKEGPLPDVDLCVPLWPRQESPPRPRWAGLGRRDRLHREQARLIGRPLAAPTVIAVVSPKGGVGKSTTTALLGATLALVRGNQVVALDANPDSGNLAARLHQRPSPLGAHDLLRDAEHMSRYCDLTPYLTSNGSGLCAVRSDPDIDTRLGPDDYRRLLGLLRRFYSLVVVDLGTGLREPAFQAIAEAADAVVAVTGPGPDNADVLAAGLDWLSGQHPFIFRTVIGVINQIPPAPRRADLTEITACLADRVEHMIQLPRDPHLASRAVLDWTRLSHRTQDACLELAAAVVGGLPAGGTDGGRGARPAVAEPVSADRSAAWRLGLRPRGTSRPDRWRAAWRESIKAPVASPKVIAVFSPRGGVGKTTTALHLGHALAMVRGDLVVAVDANPDFGNLVQRVGEPHSAHGVGGLLRAAGQLTCSSDLLPYLTRAGTGLMVVRSGEDPAGRLGPAQYRLLLETLGRHCAVVVVDLGTGMREPAFLGIAAAADALVVVTEPDAEAAESAVDAIDWVSQRIPGRDRACAMVINAARPASVGLNAGEVAAGAGLYVDQVLQIPHDAHLAAGRVSQWNRLAARTQDAYLRLGAAIMTLACAAPATTPERSAIPHRAERALPPERPLPPERATSLERTPT
jgi:MinD-like ATPase involved in chromosome partitioning or flagellar assembly